MYDPSPMPRITVDGRSIECKDRQNILQACLDAGEFCWPVPSEFTRFAIYAFIGLAEVFALFSLSLFFEKKLRDRDYAPEWR